MFLFSGGRKNRQEAAHGAQANKKKQPRRAAATDVRRRPR